VTDVFTPEKRSEVMGRVRQKNTGAELKLRKLLTRLGCRYRLHRRDLPGSPDVAMPGRKLAFFVHGCFWHGHDCPRGSRKPKQNAEYWAAKIERNRARDAAAEAALVERGWRPVIVWECEFRDEVALTGRLSQVLDQATR
jgi:DNA mismatch endonuclease (patch repair protein)